MNYENPGLEVWKYQVATLNQATPTADQWYDILPETVNVRVYQIGVNVEDTNETLEVQILVDGEIITGVGTACTHSTEYGAYNRTGAIARADYIYLTAVANMRERAYIIEGKKVQVQARKTTNAGAGNLTGIVTYGVKEQ